jgi:hypothetical protein
MTKTELLLLRKGDKMSSFDQGREAGLAKIAELVAGGHQSAEVFSYVNEVLHEPLEKTASEEDVDFRLGVESAFFGFLKEACDVYGTYQVESTEEQTQAMDMAFSKEAGLIQGEGEGEAQVEADAQTGEQEITSDDVARAAGVFKQAGLLSEDDLARLESAGLLSD